MSEAVIQRHEHEPASMAILDLRFGDQRRYHLRPWPFLPHRLAVIVAPSVGSHSTLRRTRSHMAALSFRMSVTRERPPSFADGISGSRILHWAAVTGMALSSPFYFSLTSARSTRPFHKLPIR